MTDIYLDDRLQPNLKQNNQIELVEGVEEVELQTRLGLLDNLYGIINDYNDESAREKIRLEVSRVAKQNDFVESVENIIIEKEIKDGASIFTVRVSLNESEQFETQLSEL